MPQKPRLREPFEKQHGKRARGLVKSASQHLYDIHRSLPSQLSWKKSLFFTCKILGLVVDTIPVDEKYPALNRENLTIPIEMQLSHKKNFFFIFQGIFKM